MNAFRNTMKDWTIIWSSKMLFFFGVAPTGISL